MTEAFVTVAPVADVPIGEARVFEVGNRRLALCNVDGTIYALDDTCSHDDGPLGAGSLVDHAIECPRHGARFDVRSGAVLQMPAAYPVRTYPTQIVNGEIKVNIGESQ